MITFSSSDRTKLLPMICDELKKIHDAGWRKSSTPTLVARKDWEWRFVAELCGGISNVVTAIKPTVALSHPTAKLSVTSVFTHQFPLVEWTDGSPRTTKTCELADLLLAVTDTRYGPRQKGHAILIQAKQSETPSKKLTSPGDKIQFDLVSAVP